MNDPSPAAAFGQAADLASLYLHPLNTRTEPPPLEIAALADSILACGLIQNLAAFDDPARPGRLGIGAADGDSGRCSLSPRTAGGTGRCRSGSPTIPDAWPRHRSGSSTIPAGMRT